MVCSPMRSARRLPTSADAKSSAAPEVRYHQQRSRTVIDPSPPGRRSSRAPTLCFSHGIVRWRRTAVQGDPRSGWRPRSGARPHHGTSASLRRSRLSLGLVGRLRADRRDTQVATPGAGQAPRDVHGRRRFTRHLDNVRVAGASANDRQLDLGSRRPTQRPHALENGHLACRFVVDRAQVVAGPEPGSSRRRSIACGNDAQIVLPREIYTDIARRKRSPLSIASLSGREVGAPVEAVRRPFIAPFITFATSTGST